MKKQFIAIAAVIAFAFTAGALLAGDGLEAGPESLGKTNSTDGIILAQSKFDELIRKKENKKRKRERKLARERRDRERLSRERRERDRRARERKRMSRRPLKVLKSHLSRSSSVRSSRRSTSRVRPGERVYFYYKVGPIKKHRGRAKIRTKLVVRKDGRTIYTGTWKKRNAARAGSRGRDTWIRYYESSQWSYRVATRRAKGRYRATIYFNDIDNRRNTSINYTFYVKDSRHMRRNDRGSYDRGRDRGHSRTRYYKRPAPRKATRYYKRSAPRRATRYYKRGRYGGTRYHGTRYYKR